MINIPASSQQSTQESSATPVVEDNSNQTIQDITAGDDDKTTLKFGEPSDATSTKAEKMLEKRVVVKRKKPVEDPLVTAALNVSASIQNFVTARTTGPPSTAEDEFDHFGRFVAPKLRQLATDVAATVQTAITRIMQFATAN